MAVNLDTYLAPDVIQEIYTDIKTGLLSSDPGINNILERILATRGKAVRPIFMGLIARMAGGNWESVHNAAMLIEAVHIASLLHDDVIDGSDLRRGEETINSRYSNKISVLAGDYMFIKTMILSHEIEDARVSTIIFNAVERMIRGEIRDSLQTGLLDEQTYISIAADKTAALFAAAGELGAMLSDVSEKERLWGRDLGENIGIAFQIVDDTLDYCGDPEIMGKPELSDLTAGRMTLPLIYSLRKFDEDEIEKMLSGGVSSIKKLSALVRNNGGIEFALKQARNYLQKARKIAKQFDNRDGQDAFNEFIEILVERHV